MAKFWEKRIADLTAEEYYDYSQKVSEKEILMQILKELQK